MTAVQQGSDESGEGLSEAIERALVEHVSHGGAWGGTIPGWNADCLGCDWTARGHHGGLASAIDAHRSHLADVLAEAALATGRREADELRGRLAAVEAHLCPTCVQEGGPYRCCPCCPDDPGAHENGKRNHHDLPCSSCLRAALANPSAAQGEAEVPR